MKTTKKKQTKTTKSTPPPAIVPQLPAIGEIVVTNIGGAEKVGKILCHYPEARATRVLVNGLDWTVVFPDHVTSRDAYTQKHKELIEAFNAGGSPRSVAIVRDRDIKEVSAIRKVLKELGAIP